MCGQGYGNLTRNGEVPWSWQEQGAVTKLSAEGTKRGTAQEPGEAAATTGDNHRTAAMAPHQLTVQQGMSWRANTPTSFSSHSTFITPIEQSQLPAPRQGAYWWSLHKCQSPRAQCPGMTTFSTPGCTPSQKAPGRCDSVKWKSKLKKKRTQDPGNRDTKTEKWGGGGGNPRMIMKRNPKKITVSQIHGISKEQNSKLEKTECSWEMVPRKERWNKNRVGMF